MRSHLELARATVATGCGADFGAVRQGGFAWVSPLTERARFWLNANITEETTWVDDALAVELRLFPVLADAIIDAGLTFERNTDSN